MNNKDFINYLKYLSECRLNIEYEENDNNLIKFQKDLLKWVYDNTDIYDYHSKIAWFIWYLVLNNVIKPGNDLNTLFLVIFEYVLDNPELYDVIRNNITVIEISKLTYKLLNKYDRPFLLSDNDSDNISILLE